MTKLPQFKTGDTYLLACTYKVGGVATDLTGYTITSQIRTAADVLLSSASVTIDADQVTNTGKFTVSIPAASTADWEVGDHIMDIQFELGSTVKSTETFRQPVVRDVTR
jgi:hypothetical protein